MNEIKTCSVGVRPMTLDGLTVYVIVQHPDTPQQRPLPMGAANAKLSVYTTQPAATRGLNFIVQRSICTADDGTPVELVIQDEPHTQHTPPLRLVKPNRRKA